MLKRWNWFIVLKSCRVVGVKFIDTTFTQNTEETIKASPTTKYNDSTVISQKVTRSRHCDTIDDIKREIYHAYDACPSSTVVSQSEARVGTGHGMNHLPSYRAINNCHIADHMNVLYPTHNEVVGGYVGFTSAVRPSVPHPVSAL